MNTKFLQNLLNGVNSAYKVNRGQTEKITEHVNVLYKIVHLARFNISLNTISLLFETLNHSENNDRFYGALYRVMLRPELAESSHQFLFLSLMLRSLKIDKEVNRVRAFIKRLLQVLFFKYFFLIKLFFYQRLEYIGAKGYTPPPSPKVKYF